MRKKMKSLNVTDIFQEWRWEMRSALNNKFVELLLFNEKSSWDVNLKQKNI